LSGQDPYDEAIKLLAAVYDGKLEHNESMDGGEKEDSDVTNSPQTHANNMSYSSRMTPALAATAPQGLAVAIYSQFTTPAKSPSTIPESDDLEIAEQAAEVANDKQEWEVCDIIGKEDIDREPHYWVQWSATLVSKCDIGK
jgi:hypothetical protein